MNRNDFMQFFRNNESLYTLSDIDRKEIFETILLGQSDFTADFINSIFKDYSAQLVAYNYEPITLKILFGQEAVLNYYNGILLEVDEQHHTYTYNFNTVEEKSAFIAGLEAVFGWNDYLILNN